MHRYRHRVVRWILASSALGLPIAACVSPVPTASTPAATAEATASAPGMLHLTMEPAYDQHRVRLAYVIGDTRIEGESVKQDVEVIVNRPFPAGTIQVVYDDRVCDGSVAIRSNMETDVVLALASDACAVSTTDTHPAGSIRHPELPTTASVGAFLPFGLPSAFVVRPVDAPAATPAAQEAVDGPPWEVEPIVVQPGRYEVSVLLDGVVLAREELDLERGESTFVNLRVLPAGLPRDCGEVAAAPCQSAIAEAYAWGLFLEGDTTVSAVGVRPTTYTGCNAPFTPEYTVTFVLANPKVEIAVTVGRGPDGHLGVCSY